MPWALLPQACSRGPTSTSSNTWERVRTDDRALTEELLNQPRSPQSAGDLIAPEECAKRCREAREDEEIFFKKENEGKDPEEFVSGSLAALNELFVGGS